MRKLDYLVGTRVGKLFILGRAGFDRSGNAKWEARCDCGNLCEVHTGTRSCGCLRDEARKRAWDAVRLPLGVAARNQVIWNYKASAKENNRSWALTNEKFEQLANNDCHYCGCPPSNVAKGFRSNGDFVYNGIDRLDSRKDYTEDNVVSCCWTCNWMKRFLSSEQFLLHVERIFNHKVASTKSAGA